ncbi:MAG: ester cyclase [Thermaerobacter sp.]|nr:ester cyclase [Thermaerobacter sp.]
MDPKSVVRRFVEEVQNGHQLADLERHFRPDYVDHATPGGLPPAEGADAIEAFRRFYGGILQAFPDARVTVEDMIAEGDLVVTRKTLEGTHRGELWGQPPGGKTARLEVIDIFRVVDDRLAEHWTQLDFLALARQLGLRPPGY